MTALLDTRAWAPEDLAARARATRPMWREVNRQNESLSAFAKLRITHHRFHTLRFELGPEMPGRLTNRTSPFEGANAGAIPAPAANFRPVVKQNHVSPTRDVEGAIPSRATIASLHNQECAGL